MCVSAWRRACATSCCAQQLAGSTHVGLGSRAGRARRRQEAEGSAQHAASHGPGVRAVGSHPRCTTGHLVWSCRPTGQMIPPPGSGTGTQPDRRRTLHCRCLARLAFLERSFVSPRPAQAATLAVDPDVACRRKKLQFSSSSGRCSADLVQAEADADCY